MYLTKRQLAARLGVHPNTVYRLVKMGRLPQPVNWGYNIIRWPLSEVEKFEQTVLAERPVVPVQIPKPPGRPRKENGKYTYH